MGVHGLWPLLKAAGFVKDFNSAGDNTLHDAVRVLQQNRTMAVDLSIWIVQAASQPALREAGFSDHAAVAKVCFERCVGMHKVF